MPANKYQKLKLKVFWLITAYLPVEYARPRRFQLVTLYHVPICLATQERQRQRLQFKQERGAGVPELGT